MEAKAATELESLKEQDVRRFFTTQNNLLKSLEIIFTTQNNFLKSHFIIYHKTASSQPPS